MDLNLAGCKKPASPSPLRILRRSGRSPLTFPYVAVEMSGRPSVRDSGEALLDGLTDSEPLPSRIFLELGRIALPMPATTSVIGYESVT